MPQEGVSWFKAKSKSHVGLVIGLRTTRGMSPTPADVRQAGPNSWPLTRPSVQPPARAWPPVLEGTAVLTRHCAQRLLLPS